MKIDEQGWLVAEDCDPAVHRFPTVRTYRLVVPAPIGIVWHWTSGRGGPHFAEALAKDIQTYKRGIDRPASWHVLIAKDGTIYQSAPFTVGTWHVGKAGVIAGRRFGNINQATVGCELENAGRLRKIGDRFYCWPYFASPGAPPHELRADPHYAIDAARAEVSPGDGTFDAYTPAQEKSAARMLSALVAKLGWTRDVCAYGHVDFDPARREDPGPLWKKVVLPRVLDTVFGPAAGSSPDGSSHGGAVASELKAQGGVS